MRAFEHVTPTDPGQLLELLREAKERGRAMVLAGGQDLLGELKDHLATPERVIDLKRLPGLSAIRQTNDGDHAIGALVTLAQLEEHPGIGRELPILRQAAASVGSVQIRNAGTVGGNLCQRPRCWYYRHEHVVCLKKGGLECYAYGGMSKYNAILGGGPSYIVHPSDLAPALVALGATVQILSPEGSRALPLQEFYTLPSQGDVTRETVLAPDEIVTEVRIPRLRGDGWRSTYLKFRERGSYDFALSAVALAVRMEGDTIGEARLVLGGVAPIPWRSQRAEEALVGRKLGGDTAELAADAALRGARPLEYNAYKVPLTRGLIAKALSHLANA
jgi:xanthine dehydrogenase YagS FAD-binding subunit